MPGSQPLHPSNGFGLPELLRVAEEASAAASELAMQWRRRADELLIEQKTGPGDLVSQADRQVEDAVRDVLRRHRPADGIVGEEGGTAPGSSDIEWVIDPIDGTLSYLYGLPDWAVSLAARTLDGELLAGVVASPVLHRVVTASRGGGAWCDGRQLSVRDNADLDHALVSINFGRGAARASGGRMVDALLLRVRHIRRGGSTAAALTEVAMGAADAAWSPNAHPWDVAAGVLLVQEAGGVVGDLTAVTPGSTPRSGNVLAAAPALWEPLRELLAEAYSA